MNRFAERKSVVFVVLIWGFLAALFADGANLDDLLPGTVVIHSDEDNATQTEADLLTAVPTKGPVRSHSLPRFPHKKEESQPTTPLRIIYDQDSDSLAANPVSLAETFVPLPPESPVEYESATTVHSLYLLNCTLLI